MKFLLKAIIVASVYVTFFAGAASAATRCPPDILAMTYNIRLDTKADGQNAWEYRKHFLIGQIATMRPELLGLQEVVLNQKLDLEAALPGYSFVGVGRDDGREGGEFSPLAIDKAKFRITESGTFWLSPTPDTPSLGWDAGYKRVVTWARLKPGDGGARLLVINTHWDHQGLVARRESGKLILDWIERNRRKREGIVLLGDFNADESEDSVAQLIASSADQIALRDTRRVSSSGSTGGTISFNAFDPMPKSGKLIDHIFVSEGIAVKAHGVIAQHENGRVASDHFPVVAVLKIPSGYNRPKRCP